MRINPSIGMLLLSWPAALVAQSDVASDVRAAITQTDLERHARVITSQVRPSGSAGENAAIDYIVRSLREAGVPVTVHEFPAYTSNPVTAHVAVPGTGFAPEAITVSFSASVERLRARVVDLGALSDLPDLEVGTGERLALPDGFTSDLPDVTGAIVLIDGQPRNVPVAVLDALGAIGVVFVNPEERLNELIVTSTWGPPSLRNYHRLPTMPVAEIKRSDGAHLRALMRDRSVELEMSTEVDTGWRTLRLPVARIEPDGHMGAPYVLLGGHIDAWHFGGTDEGASNAAMLSMAVAFHQHRNRLGRGLVVAWWPGHSNARYGGSTWFADTFFEELRDRAIAYLNIDGVGQMDAKRFSVTTTASLRDMALRIVRERTGAVATGSRPGRNSDESFNGIGLPLLQFNHTRLAEDGGYWWWHTPDDTFDKIDFGVLETDTDLYVDAIAELITANPLPLDVVGQFEFLADALLAREEESGGHFDLSEAIVRSRRLAELARQLETDAPGVSDLVLVDLLRPVHRVVYSPGGPYHPDPGRSLGPLPGLAPVQILQTVAAASNRYHLAMVTLVRERNRVLDALVETERQLRSLLPRDGT